MERSVIINEKMGKGLHKLFKAVVNDILQAFPILGESVSELYYFITEPKKYAEVTILSEDINKPWIKSTLEEINNLIINKNFSVQDREKGDPVTPCME